MEKRELLVTHPRSADAIVISHRQEGNALLQELRNCQLVYADILPDFLVGRHHSVIFLSVQFHRLHTERYIHARLASLKKHYRLRILLCLVDIVDCDKQLLEITRACFDFDHALFLAWSPTEAARTLEAFKIYEQKPLEFLLPSLNHLTPLQRGCEILSTILAINKLDALSLLQAFGSIKGVLTAPYEQVLSCPGIGPKKARALRTASKTPYF